ncbi:hypothetical protein CBM2637_A210104 [Cupriavidus taiwanensis]|nr:hypothetical protein CBM2637_A210104 [Cupriavidus taiwanensis]
MKNAGIRKDAGVFFCAIQAEAIDRMAGALYCVRLPSDRANFHWDGPVCICPFKPRG